MKKLLMLLVLTVLVTLGVSCGNDDKPEMPLVLNADITTVELGSVVSFTVTDGKNSIADATITGSSGAVVIDSKFTPDKAGDFSFTAKKKGFKDSNIVTVKVEEGNKLILSLVIPGKEIEAGIPVVVKVVDGAGKAVENAVVIFEGAELLFSWAKSDINGEIVFPYFLPGQHSFKVRKDDIESNEVSIKVSDLPKTKGTGDFTFYDKNFIVDKNFLFHTGVGRLDDDITKYSVWRVESYNAENDVFLAVVFATPVTLGEPEKPNGTNEIGLDAFVMRRTNGGDVLLAETHEDVEVKFVWGNQNKNIVTGDFEAKVRDLGGKPCTVKFKGESIYLIEKLNEDD